MVEKTKSANNNAYLSAYMNRLEPQKGGGTHTIKKNDTLWSIAKAKVGVGATNNTINDYMLAIAKLNGYNTKEQMNNIPLNTTIDLPVVDSFTSSKATAAKGTLQTQSKERQVSVQNEQKPKQQNQVEKIFAEKINTVLNDPTLELNKAYGINMYHMSQTKDIPYYESHSGFVFTNKEKSNVMTVALDSNNKITKFIFTEEAEDNKKQKYEVQGNIIGKYVVRKDKYGRKSEVFVQCGTVSNEQLGKLLTKVYNKIGTYNNDIKNRCGEYARVFE